MLTRKRIIFSHLAFGTIAVAAILISVIGMLPQVDILGRPNMWQSSIIALLGVVLLYLLSERAELISSGRDAIHQYLERHDSGATYLVDAREVNLELESLIRRANHHIYAVGGRSDAERYLHAIEIATGNNISYVRILTGHHITKKLHEHLYNLLGNHNIIIRWTYREKYTHMTLTDRGCIIVFPGIYPHDYTGLRLLGTDIAMSLEKDFLHVLHNADKVKGLEFLDFLLKQSETEGEPDIAIIIKEYRRIHSDANPE